VWIECYRGIRSESTSYKWRLKTLIDEAISIIKHYFLC
jgi:hypothetical protein